VPPGGGHGRDLGELGHQVIPEEQLWKRGRQWTSHRAGGMPAIAILSRRAAFWAVAFAFLAVTFLAGP
jgi:hypothetical protein